MPQSARNPIEEYYNQQGAMKFAEMINNKSDQIVKQKTRAKQRIKEIRATLLVNYGEKGRCIQGLINKSDTEYAALIKILEYYHKKVERLEQILKEKGIEIVD